SGRAGTTGGREAASRATARRGKNRRRPVRSGARNGRQTPGRKRFRRSRSSAKALGLAGNAAATSRPGATNTAAKQRALPPSARESRDGQSSLGERRCLPHREREIAGR